MVKSWQEAYRDFDSMTIAELKELLKSKGMPVSGKKMDLIRYLIFDKYQDISQKNDLRTIPGASASMWLKFQYELWLDATHYIIKGMGSSFDAINYQDIYS